MHAIHSKSFERRGAEMFYQPFSSGICSVNPVIQLKHTAFMRYILLAELARAMHSEQFLGSYVGYQFVYVILIALGAKELSGGKIKKGDSDR